MRHPSSDHYEAAAFGVMILLGCSSLGGSLAGVSRYSNDTGTLKMTRTYGNPWCTKVGDVDI